MVVLAHVLPLVNSLRDQKDAKEILVASAPWGRVAGMREAREQLRSIVA
jgi:hypothetical protein